MAAMTFERVTAQAAQVGCSRDGCTRDITVGTKLNLDPKSGKVYCVLSEGLCNGRTTKGITAIGEAAWSFGITSADALVKVLTAAGLTVVERAPQPAPAPVVTAEPAPEPATDDDDAWIAALAQRARKGDASARKALAAMLTTDEPATEPAPVVTSSGKRQPRKA